MKGLKNVKILSLTGLTLYYTCNSIIYHQQQFLRNTLWCPQKVRMGGKDVSNKGFWVLGMLSAQSAWADMKWGLRFIPHFYLGRFLGPKCAGQTSSTPPRRIFCHAYFQGKNKRPCKCHHHRQPMSPGSFIQAGAELGALKDRESAASRFVGCYRSLAHGPVCVSFICF